MCDGGSGGNSTPATLVHEELWKVASVVGLRRGTIGGVKIGRGATSPVAVHRHQTVQTVRRHRHQTVLNGEHDQLTQLRQRRTSDPPSRKSDEKKKVEVTSVVASPGGTLGGVKIDRAAPVGPRLMARRTVTKRCFDGCSPQLTRPRNGAVPPLAT